VPSSKRLGLGLPICFWCSSGLAEFGQLPDLFLHKTSPESRNNRHDSQFFASVSSDNYIRSRDAKGCQKPPEGPVPPWTGFSHQNRSTVNGVVSPRRLGGARDGSRPRHPRSLAHTHSVCLMAGSSHQETPQKVQRLLRVVIENRSPVDVLTSNVVNSNMQLSPMWLSPCLLNRDGLAQKRDKGFLPQFRAGRTIWQVLTDCSSDEERQNGVQKRPHRCCPSSSG